MNMLREELNLNKKDLSEVKEELKNAKEEIKHLNEKETMENPKIKSSDEFSCKICDLSQIISHILNVNHVKKALKRIVI